MFNNIAEKKFNADKCKAMHMGRGNPKYEYSMLRGGDCVTLESTDCKIDLVACVDNYLKLQSHMYRFCKKSSGILGLIRWSFENMDRKMFRTSITSLVNRDLQYGNILPLLQEGYKSSTKIQRRGIWNQNRRILDGKERQKQLRLCSLVNQRFWGDMTKTYKYKNSCYDIKSLLI